MGAAAGGGWSVAEHSPWELVGERVPALYPLVLVFQAVKPVLQALTLSVDAQDHAANEIVGFSNVIIPNRDFQGLLGQVPMLNLITEFLVARRIESGSAPQGLELGQEGSEVWQGDT